MFLHLSPPPMAENDVVWGFGLSSSILSWSADYSLGVRKRAGIESFPEFGNSSGAVFETIQVNLFRIVYCGTLRLKEMHSRP